MGLVPGSIPLADFSSPFHNSFFCLMREDPSDSFLESGTWETGMLGKGVKGVFPASLGLVEPQP